MKQEIRDETVGTIVVDRQSAKEYVSAIAQLESVKGLLFAENVARFSGRDSPLDNDETLIAAVHLICDGLDTLRGLELHEEISSVHPNRAALLLDREVVEAMGPEIGDSGKRNGNRRTKGSQART